MATQFFNNIFLLLLILSFPVFAQDSLNVTMIGGVAHIGPNGLTVDEEYAYIACGLDGTCIIDISNPYNPFLVGSCETLSYARDIVVKDSYAYVANDDGLQILNISDPANPIEVNWYNTLGYCNGGFSYLNYLFWADGPGGLIIFDISNPTNPIEIGNFNPSSYWVEDIDIQDNYAYLAGEWDGLRIIDISNLAVPCEIGYYNTPGQAHQVAVVDDYAYIADWSEGLRIVNITNPYSPYETGFFNPISYCLGITVFGNYAYLAASSGGLIIVDISNPYNPMEVGYYDQLLNYSQDVCVIGNLAYLANGTFFGIYDCSETLSVTAGNSSLLGKSPSLSSAYPNPFNPSSLICFQLPVASNVQIYVYDMQGNNVATLTDGWLTSGSYQVLFDATNLSSGIYFARLNTRDFIQTQKMILVK